MLKIQYRITEATRGRFAVRSRVASLLEVGTGFGYVQNVFSDI
ncbi:MAG: hypothetical protein NT138_07565 [Planctomycetales bacterium]|nr:hypothetical protein [Planctomycetales bacterium]